MRNKAASYLLLIILSLTPYVNSLKGEFVYDDPAMVLENKNVKSMTTLWQTFFDKKAMSFSGEIYRPLRDLSYRLDWIVGREKPLVYRFTNLLLHLISTLVVYQLLLLLVKDNSTALLAAAIFAVHPVHTESVAWIKGRDDILFTIFYVLSLSLYIRCHEKKGWQQSLYCAAAVIMFVFSLFSKEMAITLPVVILLYQLSFEKVRPLKLIPFLIIAILYMILRTYVLGQVAQQDYWGGGIVPTALTMLKGVSHYIRLSLFPINQCADYFSFPISTRFDISVVISLISIVFVLFLLIISKDKFVLFGGTFFFITLLPVLNIIPIKILIAERFLYLPLLGFCLMSASILQRALSQNSLFFASSMILLLFFTLTSMRVGVWLDDYALWSDTIKKTPLNARAYYGLGAAYDSKGQLDKAMENYMKAVKLAPSSPDPYNAMGLIYYNKGMINEAAEFYKKTLELDSSHKDARYNLALLEQEHGMMDQAIEDYKKLLELYPDDYDTLNNLGLAYFQKGMYEDAVTYYKKAIYIEPELSGAYNNIGMVYAGAKNCEEAERWFKKALTVQVPSPETYYNLGILYQNMGRMDVAEDAYREALSMKPTYKDAEERLLEIRAKQGGHRRWVERVGRRRD